MDFKPVVRRGATKRIDGRDRSQGRYGRNWDNGRHRIRVYGRNRSYRCRNDRRHGRYGYDRVDGCDGQYGRHWIYRFDGRYGYHWFDWCYGHNGCHGCRNDRFDGRYGCYRRRDNGRNGHNGRYRSGNDGQYGCYRRRDNGRNGHNGRYRSGNDGQYGCYRRRDNGRNGQYRCHWFDRGYGHHGCDGCGGLCFHAYSEFYWKNSDYDICVSIWIHNIRKY